MERYIGLDAHASSCTLAKARARGYRTPKKLIKHGLPHRG